MPNQYTNISNFIDSNRHKIESLFKSGLSSTKIAKILGTSRDPIDNRLITWGLRKRGTIGGSFEQRQPKAYKFKEWTDESAYWLGFIHADGCIRKNSKGHLSVFELGLQERDLNHLIKFCKFIEYEKFPVHRKKTKSFRVSFGDKEFVEDLIAMGIKPNKSNIEDFRLNPPTEFMDNYVLGLIDGDGCIYVSPSTKRSALYFVGGIDTANMLKSYFKKGCITHDKRHSAHIRNFSCCISHKDIPLLKKWIDNPLQLEAKKKKCIEALEIQISKCRLIQ